MIVNRMFVNCYHQTILPMDDQVYNQIFLKPRFQFDFAMNATELLARFEVHKGLENTYRIKVVDEHIVIDVPEKEAHYWSPQLQLEIEGGEDGLSKIRGLFGPKPQVWTLFMFIHFAVGTAFVVFAVLAYANYRLEKSLFLPVTMLVVLPLIWISLYFIGSIGKATGQKQMDDLKAYTKGLLLQLKSSA